MFGSDAAGFPTAASMLWDDLIMVGLAITFAGVCRTLQGLLCVHPAPVMFGCLQKRPDPLLFAFLHLLSPLVNPTYVCVSLPLCERGITNHTWHSCLSNFSACSYAWLSS
jgi:hypothetical protein